MRWVGISRLAGDIGDVRFRIPGKFDRCFIATLFGQFPVAQSLASQSTLQDSRTESGDICRKFKGHYAIISLVARRLQIGTLPRFAPGTALLREGYLQGLDKSRDSADCIRRDSAVTHR